MTNRLLRLRSADAAAREAFHAFVPLTFRSVDFRVWDRRGGWNDDYEAFLLQRDGETQASVGVTRMRLCIAGHEGAGYQLGAVATHPQRRGRGHSRELLQQVLAHIDAQAAPSLLFANARVLDFYPRFGFRALSQRRYAVSLALSPAGALAPVCEVSEAAARECLAALCAQAPVNDRAFGARDYYSTLLWHLTYRPIRAHWLDDGHALAAVEQAGDRLVLHDLIALRRFDLAKELPRTLTAPVAQIEFGFQPRAWWPQASDIGLYEGSPLFVRGMDTLHAGELRFPDLAQT